MNIIFFSIFFFILVFLFLSWFARQKTKKITRGARRLIIIFSLLIAIVLAIGGRILFSLPLFFLAISALKIKGLTAFQIWQIWRLLNYLRSTGRYSHFGQNNQTRSSSTLSKDEAFKILGLKPGSSKEQIIKAANLLQKKIHPDVNPNANTERLSQIVNEAKETLLKSDIN
jgi:hypothetical protein